MILEADDERRILARIVRQRLEAMGRAGIDRIPIAAGVLASPAIASKGVPVRPTAPTKPSLPVSRPEPEPIAASKAPSIPAPRPSIPPAAVSSLFGEPTLEVFVP